MLNTLKLLFIFDNSGKVSSTKFWSSIAYAVSTWVIIRLTQSEHLTTDVFTFYLLIATGHASLTKFLNQKQNNGSYRPPIENGPDGRPTAAKRTDE